MGLRLVIPATVLVAALASFGPAPASKICVGYLVETTEGTQDDEPCPVTNPEGFTVGWTVGDCAGVPDIGLTVCAEVTVYTPA